MNLSHQSLMRYTLASLSILVPSNAFAQWDAGADVNSIEEVEAVLPEADAGPRDMDAFFRKESPGDPCGDGFIEYDEDCDGTALNGETCETMGYAGGTLACDRWCDFDTSGCTGGICGDGLIEEEEDCEQDDIGDATCTTIGYESGDLRCNAETCRFDTSACIGAVCGDGRVSPGEDCEGQDHSLCPYGQPAYYVCLDCQSELCQEQYCGDAIIQRNEHCDTALPGADRLRCRHLNVNGARAWETDGAVCLDDCTSTCAYCGDGEVQAEFEECEPWMRSDDACRTEFGREGVATCDPETCQWSREECGSIIEHRDVGTEDASVVENQTDSQNDAPANSIDASSNSESSGEERAANAGCSAVGDASSWTMLACLLFGLSALRLRRRGGGV